MRKVPSKCSLVSGKSDAWSLSAMCAWLLLNTSSLKRDKKSVHSCYHPPDGKCRVFILILYILSSPEHKWHVALLALAALHGAIQRHTGVSEREVVQPAVHVVCVAFVALKIQRGGQEKCFNNLKDLSRINTPPPCFNNLKTYTGLTDHVLVLCGWLSCWLKDSEQHWLRCFKDKFGVILYFSYCREIPWKYQNQQYKNPPSTFWLGCGSKERP